MTTHTAAHLLLPSENWPQDNKTGFRICWQRELSLVDKSPNYATFSLIINGILTTICVLFGCAGNFATGCSFKKGYLTGRTVSLTLTYLAFWDNILLVSTWCYYSLECLWKYSDPSRRLQMSSTRFTYLSFLFHPLINISFTCSSWLIAALTMQRFLAIYKPLRRYSVASLRSGWCSNFHLRIPFVLTVIVILLQTPSFFELEVTTCWNDQTGEWGSMLIPTTLRLDSNYQLVYRIVMKLVLTTVGPIIFITLVTVLIILTLHSANNTRHTMIVRHDSNREARKEIFTTFLLIALVVKFLASHCLPGMLDIWETVIGYDRGSPLNFTLWTDVSNFLVVANSATNFLIFIPHGRAIGATLARTFRVWKQPSAKYIHFTRKEICRLKSSWKQIMIGEIRRAAMVQHDLELIQAWTKVVDFIIAELKLGFLQEAGRECSLRETNGAIATAGRFAVSAFAKTAQIRVEFDEIGSGQNSVYDEEGWRQQESTCAESL